MPPDADQVLDSPGNFQPVSEVPQGTDSNIQNLLTSYVERAFGSSNISLSKTAAIVCTATHQPNQAPSYALSYYAADAVSPTSVYCLGSVTKVFTGSLLVARWLSGDDTSIMYTPNVAGVNALLGMPPNAEGSQLTYDTTKNIYNVLLTQLATHSACFGEISATVMNQGLYDGGGNPSDDQIQAWLSSASYLPQGCQLGQKSTYSNWGFITLAFALSRPSYPGASDIFNYDPALQHYVLPTFGIDPETTNTNTQANFVQGYNKAANPAPATGLAHGLHSNVTDMSNLLLGYMTGINQYQSQSRNPLSDLVYTAITPPLPTLPNQAYAWSLGKVGKIVPIVAKNGLTNEQGFAAWIAFAPGQSGALLPRSNQYEQVGVVVLVNRATSPGGPAPSVLGTDILTYLLGQPLTVWPGLEIDDPEISDD